MKNDFWASKPIAGRDALMLIDLSIDDIGILLYDLSEESQGPVAERRAVTLNLKSRKIRVARGCGS